MGLNILFHIVILIGGSEYIKEIKTNPRFYTYGSVFKKPQSFLPSFFYPRFFTLGLCSGDPKDLRFFNLGLWGRLRSSEVTKTETSKTEPQKTRVKKSLIDSPHSLLYVYNQIILQIKLNI